MADQRRRSDLRLPQKDHKPSTTLYGLDAVISAAPRAVLLQKRSGDISNDYRLIDAQMAKLDLVLAKSRGKPLLDDKRVLSGLFFINRIGALR